jgi:apolipoprotein N-acyltransferase
MAFSPSYRRFLEALLAIAASAALLYFGNGLEPLWPLVWFAPLPILLLALRSDWRTTALSAVAVIMIANLNLWVYLTKAIMMPGFLWVVMCLPMAVAFAAGVLLFRALVLRGALLSGLLALPAVWVAAEYVRNLTWPHGSAASLAYSQLKFLPFLQLASITGPWGMSFVLLLLPAAIAIALHLRSTSPRLALRVMVAGFGVIAIVLVFGAIRLAQPEAHKVKVGLIATDMPGTAGQAPAGPVTERCFREYARAAHDLIRNGAQVIVMPEGIATTTEATSAASDAVLQSVTNRTGVAIVAGVMNVEGPSTYDEARIYTPDTVVRKYDKEHLLPPFESDLKPGMTLTTLSPQHQNWAVAICKDMDFTSPARLYGEAGVGLMFVPAGDFILDRTWHGHIAVMRGVEDGFSVVRTARKGFLTVSDDRGRILGEVRSSSAPFATLLVDVPSAHRWTVFSLLGDWFAWTAILLVIATLIQMIRIRGQHNVTSERNRFNVSVCRIVALLSKPSTPTA